MLEPDPPGADEASFSAAEITEKLLALRNRPWSEKNKFLPYNASMVLNIIYVANNLFIRIFVLWLNGSSLGWY